MADELSIHRGLGSSHWNMIQAVAKATCSKPLKGTAVKLHYVFQIYTHGQSLRTD